MQVLSNQITVHIILYCYSLHLHIYISAIILKCFYFFANYMLDSDEKYQT